MAGTLFMLPTTLGESVLGAVIPSDVLQRVRTLDYFVAENPRGETVWIYRDHRYGIDDGEWFLHGVFA